MKSVDFSDTTEKVDNRFELVLLASYRARALANGRSSVLECTNSKSTVLALREIDSGMVNINSIKNDWVNSMQKYGTAEAEEVESFKYSSVEDEVSPVACSAEDTKTVQFDELSEEDLLRYLEDLVPPGENDGC